LYKGNGHGYGRTYRNCIRRARPGFQEFDAKRNFLMDTLKGKTLTCQSEEKNIEMSLKRAATTWVSRLQFKSRPFEPKGRTEVHVKFVRGLKAKEDDKKRHAVPRKNKRLIRIRLALHDSTVHSFRGDLSTGFRIPDFMRNSSSWQTIREFSSARQVSYKSLRTRSDGTPRTKFG